MLSNNLHTHSARPFLYHRRSPTKSWHIDLFCTSELELPHEITHSCSLEIKSFLSWQRLQSLNKSHPYPRVSVWKRDLFIHLFILLLISLDSWNAAVIFKCFFKKRRRRKENIKDISSRKPQKALKTIWDSDAAEASLRLLFSTFSGQSLSHPIWINRWASRSSSTFLSNEISLKITHCRSDIRALDFHGWTPKSHPLLYILMFSNHII